MNRRYPGLDFNMDYNTEFDKQTGFGYEAMAGSFFREVIRRVPIPHRDIRFLDIGCGKGNTLFSAKKYGFAKVAGVELSDKFFTACENNMRILGLDDVTLYHQDASTLENELDEYNMIFLFNPFPEEVMKRFLQHLKESMSRTPRAGCIVYAHPVFGKVFVEMGFQEWHRFEMETYYYSNADAIYYNLEDTSLQCRCNTTSD